MEKRYQVFVSSTYQDLHEERQEVMQALLELDCIPSGMELFPAASDDQWTLIRKVIDDCDYYLVIVGGRYGSIGPDGISYTEMEYRYALEKNKPIIGFLHKDPGSLPSNRCENDPSKREKLESFRELLKRKMIRNWESPADLGSAVSRSLIHLIKNSPGVGWVRADSVPDAVSVEETLKLKLRIEYLEAQLASAATVAPDSAKDLAQGSDSYKVAYEFTGVDDENFSSEFFSEACEFTWDEIIGAVSPMMINEASEDDIKEALGKLIESRESDRLRKTEGYRELELRNFKVADADFQTIKVQLSALGLIARSLKQHSVKDFRTYWTLTPYGESVMTQLRAIRRPHTQPKQL